jgi:MoaA/NifB/PqqE/SkfB family radical SAM enzyme
LLREVSYFALHNLRCRLLRERTPVLGGFKLTHRCNLHCRACPFWKLETPDLGFSGVQETLHQLHDAGVRLLIFEGGEPFLWRDGERSLDDVVEEAKKLFFCVGVTTNGTLTLDSPADILWVSIDGLAETHDRLRGRSFIRIVENLERSRHPKLYANITINRQNRGELRELVKFLAPKVKGITIQFYYPYPETEDLRLTPDERVRALEELMELKREGYAIACSLPTLEALKGNTWRCHSWLIASAEPDGSISYGCYLQGRAQVSCTDCGFAAHTEMSLAYDANPAAIRAGLEVFGLS